MKKMKTKFKEARKKKTNKQIKEALTRRAAAKKRKTSKIAGKVGGGGVSQFDSHRISRLHRAIRATKNSDNLLPTDSSTRSVISQLHARIVVRPDKNKTSSKPKQQQYPKQQQKQSNNKNNNNNNNKQQQRTDNK